jgi:WD40 repeat protein
VHGHGSLLLAAALSADGARAYTIALDQTARVWDARSGAELRALNFQGHQLAASPDGKHVAVAAGRTVRLYDPELTREAVAVVVDDLPCGLAYVRGGRDLVVVTADGGVTVRDPETGAERSRSKARLALDRGTRQLLNIGSAVAVSADGRLLAQGGLGGRVRVWDAATGQLLFEEPESAHLVGTPAISPDGKVVAAPSADGTIRLWDIADRRAVQTLRGHRSAVWAVTFSPDGKQLASASKDLTARVWDPATGELLLTFAGHGGEVRAVRYSADGTRLITASPDGTARVWDPADRVVVSDHVRAASARQAVPLYSRAGSPEHLTFYGHLAPAVTIACSDDGRLVATSAARDEKSDYQVLVWQAVRVDGPGRRRARQAARLRD